MSTRFRSISTLRYLTAALAAIIALVGGVIVSAPPPARSMQLLIPPGGTIQGVSTCGTSPTSNDILTFGGTNWCGSQSVRSTRVMSVFSGGTPPTGNDGGLVSDMASAQGEIKFGESGEILDYGGANAGQWTFTGGSTVNLGALTINGDDKMSSAPRMFMTAVDYANANPQVGRPLTYWEFPKGATIDNCNYVWGGWAGCTVAPTYRLRDTTASSSLETMGVTTTAGEAACSSLNTAIAAGDSVQFDVLTSAVGCTQAAAVGYIQVNAAYHMQ